MSVIKLLGFSGEQPRVIPRLMPEMSAQSAINTRLDDGALTPMRESIEIETLTGVTAPLTIFPYAGGWLAWDDVVYAVPGPVDQNRLYYTGDGAPKMRVGTDVYPLALAPPVTALTPTLGGVGAGDVVSRFYVYTWVTAYGEESEPCPASVTVDWQPGNSVTLSAFANAPSGRNITKQRIYRTQTGAAGTGLYLIAERNATNADYVDTIAVDAFQDPLPSVEWNAPPAALDGMVSLPNGIMAAFIGRAVYFSEPFRPHAWPEKYILSTDVDIVGLGAVGSTLIVMTKGTPYLISGTHPGTMQMTKIEQNFPCINPRAIVDLGYAIAYPTVDGVAMVRADGTLSLATANIFSRDNWLALSPSTMIGCQISGRYVVFYDTLAPDGTRLSGMLFFDLAGQSFLIRSDENGTAAYYDLPTGSLYFVRTNTPTAVRRFDAPVAARLSQFWKSKAFVFPEPVSFGAIQIDTTRILSGEETENMEVANLLIIAENEALIAAGSVGGELNASALGDYELNGDGLTALLSMESPTVNVSIIADGTPVAAVTSTGRIVRLPAKLKARTWEITVFGDAQIQQIVMASTVDELKRAA